MEQVLIHVGMPKCGSSTLQKHVFCKLTETQNFGLYPTNNIAGKNGASLEANAIYLHDENLFDFYKQIHNNSSIPPDKLKSIWQSVYDENRNHHYKNLLLSHEALTAPFFSLVSQQEKATRLKSLFPDAKILIIVRNQPGWLRSQYRDHPFLPTNLSRGKPVSFNTWINLVMHHEKLASIRESLQYTHLINRYAKLFGIKNIYILAFEDLAKNPILFSQALSKFLDVTPEWINTQLYKKHENKGLSAQYNLLRQIDRRNIKINFINCLVKKLLDIDTIKKLPQKKYKLDKTVTQTIENLYREDNLRLSKIVGIKNHSYPGLEGSQN